MSHAVVNPDREQLVTCPYDPSHKVTQMRLPYHLIKCRKNHKDKEFSQCPYDAKHVILKAQFQEHLQICDKKAIIEPQLVMVERNFGLLIPPSQAVEIEATLSNEWDLEMPSTAFTNNSTPENGEWAGEHQVVNSFSSSSNTGSVMAQGTEGGKGGYNTGVSYDRYIETVPASYESIDYQDQFEYSQALPRKPHSSKKKKNGGPGRVEPQSSSLLVAETSSNVTSAIGEALRKPSSSSSKSASINSTNSNKTPRSYGCGRAASMQAQEGQGYLVTNQNTGSGSYVVKSPPEHIDRYNRQPVSSFGRGRGASYLNADQPTLRKPGMSEKGTKEVLEKERLKLMKQIMEAKLLEERLAKGELLEKNQVCSIAIITVSYQFLLSNSS